MKYLLSIILFIAAAGLSAQEVQKPKVQTSARPEQTAVYQGKGGKLAQADTQAQTKSEAQAKPEAKAAKARTKKQKPAQAAGGDYTRQFALKSNLAYDAAAMLNLAFEMTVRPHISVEIPVVWSLWDLEREHGLRLVGIQPEARYWLDERADRGHFAGVHVHAAWYNVKWNDTRYQDTGRPLLGAGLTYGYRLPLGEHWAAELALGLGYANMKHDTYYNIDNGAWLDTRRRNYWGVTKLVANLVYRF